MKTKIAMMTAIVLIAIQFTTATEPSKKFTTEEKMIAFAGKNLLIAVRSTNPGVIESAMRITAQMKMKYPTADVTELVNAMNEVWQKNPSGSTRYKAYIAMSICGNPEWYSDDSSVVTANEENFFHEAADRLQEQLLSANTQ